MNVNGELRNSTQLPTPARIEHIHGELYRVHFDSNGDGKLNDQTTGILYGTENLESNLD